jgi:hypothetical protein
MVPNVGGRFCTAYCVLPIYRHFHISLADQDLHYSLKQQHKTIPAAVKQIWLFKVFNASLKSFVDAQQTDAPNNVYMTRPNMLIL